MLFFDVGIRDVGYVSFVVVVDQYMIFLGGDNVCCFVMVVCFDDQWF